MAKTQMCNPKALGISLAIVFGLYMLILSIGGWIGFWADAVATMAEFHIGYSLTVLGTIIGIVEAAIFGFIAGWLIAWFYNKYK